MGKNKAGAKPVFLSLSFFGLPCFFSFRGLPCLLERFSLFQAFWGFGGEKTSLGGRARARHQISSPEHTWHRVCFSPHRLLAPSSWLAQTSQVLRVKIHQGQQKHCKTRGVLRVHGKIHHLEAPRGLGPPQKKNSKPSRV